MDWIATILTFTGVYLVGQKKTSGWFVSLLGAILWLVYAASTGQTALAVTNILFMGMHTYYWLEWSVADSLNVHTD